MKIGVLSDLFLEEYGTLPHPTTLPDVLVLAGNIGQGTRGLEWAMQNYRCPIVYVLGSYSYRERNIETLDAELRARASYTNVHILQNETLILRGVRFVGATLWSDFNLFGDAEAVMFLAQEGILDYYLIRDSKGASITPAATRAKHLESVRFLERTLGEPFAGPTVVVTHHAPSLRSVPPRYRGDTLMASFASNLDGLVEHSRAKYWIHGCQHDSVDYTLGDTRVLANPRGYPQEELAREVGRFSREYFVEV
jgi:hypothetical protein